MGKQRYINTKFWDDNYIRTLHWREKLLYLYLLTSPLTNICGIYEISIPRISFDTGIEIKEISRILRKFRRSGKVRYEEGYVAIKNFIRSQADNPKIRAGISYELSTKPQSLVDFVDTLDYKPATRKGTRVKIGKKLREKIFKKYPTCCLCGAVDDLEIDHIVPIFKGGTNDEKNLRVLCQSCNGKRNSKMRWNKDENGWDIDSSPKKENNLPTNINFNYNKESFEGITSEYVKELEKNYPGVDVENEIAKMCRWLLDNPKKKRQGKRSFINNWLKRVNGRFVESGTEGIPRLKQGDFNGM